MLFGPLIRFKPTHPHNAQHINYGPNGHVLALCSLLSARGGSSCPGQHSRTGIRAKLAPPESSDVVHRKQKGNPKIGGLNQPQGNPPQRDTSVFLKLLLPEIQIFNNATTQVASVGSPYKCQKCTTASVCCSLRVRLAIAGQFPQFRGGEQICRITLQHTANPGVSKRIGWFSGKPPGNQPPVGSLNCTKYPLANSEPARASAIATSLYLDLNLNNAQDTCVHRTSG